VPAERPALAAVLLSATLALSACGPGTLAASAVAAGAADALVTPLGVRPTVSCPKDLAATVGARERCTFTVSGDPTRYGGTVTVTAVTDGEATFAVQVDRRPVT
jgi:hypothetical protein